MPLVKYHRRPLVNNFFDDFFGAGGVEHTRENRGLAPAVNVRENDEEYTIEVAAPGMSKEDFNVEKSSNGVDIKEDF